jgi:type III pantothenate kinase
MLLAIDIGNSTIECGVSGADGKLLATWRSSGGPGPAKDAISLEQDLLDRGLRPRDINGVVLCSVVPDMTGVVERAVREFFQRPPLIMTTGIDAGIVLRYTNPAELGNDRFVAAARAYAMVGRSVIVVDIGTATTFSVVDDSGNFLGGAISPGLGISREALEARTAQLPHVDFILPPSPIGRDTVTGIQSGLIYGHAAMIDGMIGRLQAELRQPAVVMATGGYAPVLAAVCTKIENVLPHLVLDGLIWLHRRAQPEEK